MRGVGDELALRVHGGVERVHRVLERVEHRVEAARQAPELVLPGGLDASAEVARGGDVLGGVAESLQRLHGGAGDQAPEQRRERDAADDEQHEDQAQAAEQAVDFGERQRELDGAPAAERLGEHAQVDALDVRVAEERPAAVRGQRARGGAHRQRHPLRRADHDRAVGVDHLLVAADLVGSGREAVEDVAFARAGLRAGVLTSARRIRAGGARRRRAEHAFGGEPQLRAAAQRDVAEVSGFERAHEPVGRALAMAQLRVDLAVQLIGGEQIGEDRREHHRDGDGGGGGDRDAPAEAHCGVRST